MYPPEVENVSTHGIWNRWLTEAEKRMGFMEYETNRVEKLKSDLRAEQDSLETRRREVKEDDEVGSVW